MRLTLEQLKAMNNEELHDHWAEAKFPFENMACGNCLTSHYPGYVHACTEHEHEQIRRNMSKFPFEGGLNLRPYVEELYALRLFYDSLYRADGSEPSLSEALAESEASAEVVAKNLTAAAHRAPGE